MKTLEQLIYSNRKWAEGVSTREPEFFQKLVHQQNPQYLWIGCSDSRVPANEIVGLMPGELFVHRNVANIVAYNDINIASVIQYATVNLGIEDIVVCGHYGCGGIRAACAEPLPDGYLGDWLNIAGWAKLSVDQALEREGRSVGAEEYHRQVVEENIRLQIKHLSHLGLIRRQRAECPGVPRLHGWVYDIGTGLVKIVAPGDT